MVAEAIAVVTIGPLDKPADMATAFPIGEEFVIAPRHVVFDKESDNLFDKIEISWVRVVHKGQNEQYEKFGRTEKVELGCDLGELADLVLLKCEIPTEFHNYFYLSEIFPETHDRWETFGYAKVRADPNNLEQTPAHGNCNAVDVRRPKLALKYETGPLDIREWGGMSGAPICKGRCVLAVVLQVENPGRSKGTFYAVPMAWLLEPKRYPKFRDLVCLSPDQKILDSAEQLLSRSHVACKFLEDATKNSGHEFKNLRECIEILARISIAEFVCIVRDAQSILTKSSSDSGLVLGQFLAALLPLTISGPEVEQIRQGKLNGKIGVVRLRRHATTISAEMLMARADLRAVCFSITMIDSNNSNSQVEIKPSNYALEIPPESGEKIENDRKSIETDLFQRFGGNVDKSRDAVTRYLYQDKVRKIGRPRSDPEDMAPLVKNHLEMLAKNGRPSLYFPLYDSPKQPHERPSQDWLDHMANNFPLLAFVVLADDDALEIKEQNDYFLLTDIYGLADAQSTKSG